MSIQNKERILAKFGGTGEVAAICGVTAGAVSQWDIIPARHQMTLLQEARARGINLTSDVFLGGACGERKPSKKETPEPRSGREMTGAEMIIQAMLDNDTDVVFGYPGGAVLPVYDALFKQNKLRHILVRHEQGAGHAAEGYARATGKCGVLMVTSGPGATNTVTALCDALMDSIPLVCVTGQVPTHLIGTDAFQEADVVGITRSATKHNYLVKNVNDLGRIMHEAFHVAMSGRPGPVLVDVPKDILNATGIYRESQATIILCGRRRGEFWRGCVRKFEKACHCYRLSGDDNADGAGCVSGYGQTVFGDAGDARLAGSEHVYGGMRCDDKSRCAIR
jgi:Thiamine pyrophosphate enzyme, N-terminal TPP binding domain/DNA-binding transcriptional regulator Cro